MRIDRYPPEDVFARVPALAAQTDPVLVALDRLLEDDPLYPRVRTDRARRSRLTPVQGRHATPAELLLRLLVVQHLSGGSALETGERGADWLVVRWCCRVDCRRVPEKAPRLRWAHPIPPTPLQARTDRARHLAQPAQVTRARTLRIDRTCCVQTPIHHPPASRLLGEGVRVLHRLIQRAKPLVAEPLAGVRPALRWRRRAVRRRRRPVHRISRVQGEAAAAQPRARYVRRLERPRQTGRPAERVRDALVARGERDQMETAGAAADARAADQGSGRLRAQLAQVLPLVRRVLAPAPTRVLEGRPVPAARR
jgi:transposase, IS5 family